MISVNQARHIIESQVKVLGLSSLPIEAANNYILSDDVLAGVDNPNFNNSAVDGYAFSYDALDSEKYNCQSEVSAGQVFSGTFNPKEDLLRIFTGAAVPDCCDTVVMQEDVEVNNNLFSFNKSRIKRGANVRLRAEQIKLGDIALKKGTKLTAASLAYLASLGVEAVPVFRKARVASLITGNELRPVGSMLSDGEIYESNGILLSSYLNQMNILNQYNWVKDDLNSLKRAIKDKLEEHDLILVSGGVSVGDYDYTRAAIESLGFEILFHGVKQKPAKPILLAKKGEKYICGLPGNPRSVQLCFQMYVYPILKILAGSTDHPYITMNLPIEADFKRKDDGKSYFLNAELNAGSIKISKFQQSHMLASSASSNVLVELSPEQINLKAGDAVTCHILPYV